MITTTLRSLISGVFLYFVDRIYNSKRNRYWVGYYINTLVSRDEAEQVMT